LKAAALAPDLARDRCDLLNPRPMSAEIVGNRGGADDRAWLLVVKKQSWFA
jgi:hypothetical protein